MWIRREDDIIYFNISDLKEIKIKKILMGLYYVIQIVYTNGKKKNFCVTRKYNVALGIFNIIVDNIENNNAIRINIPYYISNKFITNNVITN